MSTSDNIEIAQKWNLIILNERKLDELDEVMHEHYRWHGGTGGPWSVQINGREALKNALASNFARGDHDTKVVIEDIFGSDDKVAVRMTMMRGEKPAQTAIAIYRFSEGKIIDDWACMTPMT